MDFRPALREQSRLRFAACGPAGSGKTFTELRLAHLLGGKTAVIDTERGSAAKYVGESPDGIEWAFDVVELKDYNPDRFTELITLAGRRGYKNLIVDSLSHAWEGQGGALDIKAKISGDDWRGWRSVTPMHNRMVDAILTSPCNVFITMRSKMEYVMDRDASGKSVLRRVGLAPIQRPGLEYEFDVIVDLDYSHTMTVAKSRLSIIDGLVIHKPGPSLAQALADWLAVGKPSARPEAFTEQIAQPGAVQAAQPGAQGDGMTLDLLVDTFGVDAVLAANGGIIPATDADLVRVAESLGV